MRVGSGLTAPHIPTESGAVVRCELALTLESMHNYIYPLHILVMWLYNTYDRLVLNRLQLAALHVTSRLYVYLGETCVVDIVCKVR